VAVTSAPVTAVFVMRWTARAAMSAGPATRGDRRRGTELLAAGFGVHAVQTPVTASSGTSVEAAAIASVSAVSASP
jgi:hypothetical protein